MVFTTEGSGKGTKYFVQLGADAESKKQLGKSTEIYYKSGPGPWDFSAEFPGGVGFDVANCRIVLANTPSSTTAGTASFSDVTLNKATVTCNVQNILTAPHGTYDNVTASIITSSHLSSEGGGFAGQGNTYTIGGCMYIPQMIR